MNLQSAWTYALHHYAQPGAAAELLRRQDEEGLDVVLHLFVQWAHENRGIVLDAAALREAAATVANWREHSVLPLRALRRAMKGREPEGAAEAARAVRQQIQQAELAAERVELELLSGWLARREAQPGQMEAALDKRGPR